MGLESIDQPGQSSEFECSPKMGILFLLAGEGWQTRFESIDQPGQSSEFECSPKMSILFLLAGEGWQRGFQSIDQPGWSSEVECNPKTSISFDWLERGGGWGSSPLTSPADHQKLNVIQKWAFYFFLAGEGWQTGFESIDQSGLSSEVECNPKTSISFFWLEMGGRWGSSLLTSPADHQKLNVIQKWAFYFFGWRGVADRVWVHWPARLIIRRWM